MTLTPKDQSAGCPAFPFAPPEDPLGLPSIHSALHQQGPVVKVALPPGQQDVEAWLATGHEEVLRVYRDDAFQRAPADGVRPFLQASPIIIALDGEHHRRVRGLVQAAFTPAKVRKLRPAIEDLAAGLLDEMLETGEPGDLAEDFAMKLTLGTIATQFAIPEQDYSQFRGWAEALITVSPGQADAARTAMEAMVGYMAQLMPQRAGAPGDDLVSMVAVNAEASGVDAVEAGLSAASLVTGGWESTGGALICLVHRLLTTDGKDGNSLYSALAADPALIPTAIEELLRITPNSVLAATQPRRAVRDVELGGVLIRAGEVVIPSPDSAGRDPKVFPDPETLDLTRSPNPHLAFGSGSHVCIGAPLGRLELQVALELLTRRLPALRLTVPADELVWRWDRSVIRRPETYPVVWNPTDVETADQAAPLTESR